MTDVNVLKSRVQVRCDEWMLDIRIAFGELTVEVNPAHLLDICRVLRDDAEFDFKLLVDVCGVDYLQYGLDDWATESTTATGFSRGVTCFVKGPQEAEPTRIAEQSAEKRMHRFAVVYHLLSLSQNQRIRLRVTIPEGTELIVDSVMSLWDSADWFEREAFDLFGILFKGHPDLRRLLTDYGFIGHPFRKDFPLIGTVEARYDATLKRVIYEPVSIDSRFLEPKVIRDDSRYLAAETKSGNERQ